MPKNLQVRPTLYKPIEGEYEIARDGTLFIMKRPDDKRCLVKTGMDGCNYILSTAMGEHSKRVPFKNDIKTWAEACKKLDKEKVKDINMAIKMLEEDKNSYLDLWFDDPLK